MKLPRGIWPLLISLAGVAASTLTYIRACSDVSPDAPLRAVWLVYWLAYAGPTWICVLAAVLARKKRGSSIVVGFLAGMLTVMSTLILFLVNEVMKQPAPTTYRAKKDNDQLVALACLTMGSLPIQYILSLLALVNGLAARLRERNTPAASTP